MLHGSRVAALVSQVAILALGVMRWKPGSPAPVMRTFMFDGMLAFISISSKYITSSLEKFELYFQMLTTHFDQFSCLNGAHDMYPPSTIIHHDQLRVSRGHQAVNVYSEDKII